MNLVKSKKMLATVVFVAFAAACIFVVYLALIPTVKFVNTTGGELTDVSIRIRTSVGEETISYPSVPNGRQITVRRNTSDLVVGSFAANSIHGSVLFPVSVNLTPTEKLRIEINTDRRHELSLSRFW